MDRRERIPDLTLALQSALAGWQAGIWTALPGTWQAAGSKVGTANVQPTVQVQTMNPNTNAFDPPVNLPLCLDCPIIFPGGGGAHLTFPLATGDEGLLVFASRCIDNWWLSGGPQSQAEFRMHDLSDGFFIPGCFSQPRAPAVPPSTTLVQLASDDGVTLISMDTTTQAVTITAPGGINLVGPISLNGVAASVPGAGILRITGTLQATGGVVAGQGTGDQVGLQTHLHAGVAAGGASTAAPTAGT